ncbi:hypothetical protein RS24_00334 [Candidatus Micropelagos thuwalensis]|uniref:Major facilitator superfamily (MFS) profile domain-containing protein n=1 Tax=Candidatus Micropelagius thuwalensis TaxID=1397666 RepID=U2WV28_9PROT|nr:MFS transporter [Candidatus Micropelagos thuwalensis]ERL47395.1 hypothetical protein RS24_00334 [Candidatus Micropelagos thuwalensis]
MFGKNRNTTELTKSGIIPKYVNVSGHPIDSDPQDISKGANSHAVVTAREPDTPVAVSTGLVPITNSFVVETAPTRLRGIYSGILQCGYPLGWFFTSLIATPLLTDFGWRAMFLPALAVIPIAFLMGRVLPESLKFSELKEQDDIQPEKLSMKARLGILLSNEYRSRAILEFIAFFFFGGAYAGTAFYFPTFFQEVRGYTPEVSTLLVGISYGRCAWVYWRFFCW